MKTIFGQITQYVELINQEKLNNGSTKTTFKFGKLYVVGHSNRPSSESLNRVADEINVIAENHINEIDTQIA
ncbi:acyl-CoA thioester hydrolase [Fictibacillus sp. KU28468]|uniref:acyl-CoA thioester hydrolase n=1 Tax=Fictibacillus sp. KU28468 TaxID=2991053 RepID=UPI00223DF2D5|nr:acyl-CoA thioester hydrolase [Fictibacillus sp. KU28468]UZJ79441.1 acyl-CoA thioester hydrolase [Fictibacillus sp. KU28468]